MNPLLDPRLSDCRRIYLHEFAFDASIGFHDFEREARQRVLVSVDLFVPLHATTPTRAAMIAEMTRRSSDSARRRRRSDGARGATRPPPR